MSLNVGGLNLNSGIVSGAELEKVSREIFSAAPRTSEVQQPKTDLSVNLNRFQPVDNGINLFEKGVDISFTKQVASTKTGHDVQLSQNAMANIHALNTQAAKAQNSNIHNNIHRHVEGKLHLQTDTEFKNLDLKSVFAMSNEPKLFNTMSLDKDRRGSSPFDFTGRHPQENNKEEKESLSIFA